MAHQNVAKQKTLEESVEELLLLHVPVKPRLHQMHVTSIPDEQLVSIYMSTDTSSKQCSTSGYIYSRDDNFVADTGYSDKGYKWIKLVSGLHVSGVNGA